jgi:DNA-binding MarR family transcriptional regulator
MAGARKRATPTSEPAAREMSDYRPHEVSTLPWLTKQAEREMAKAIDRELRHTGLTKSQFGVLQALVHLEKASSAALARTVFVTPQAMVGIVAGLEAKGFIRRKTSRASARVIEATVTAAGKAAYEEGVRMMRHVDDALAAEFDAKEMAQFTGFLDRMINAVQKSGAGRG